MKPVVLWHRYDLRVNDNIGLKNAISTGVPVYPVFIYSPESEAPWSLGEATRWWLHYSLESLSKSYKELGLQLTLLKAEDSNKEILSFLNKLNSSELFFDVRYEPAIRKRDELLKKIAIQNKIKIHAYENHTSTDYLNIQSSQLKPYQVFSQFYKKLEERIAKESFEYLSYACDFKIIPSKHVETLKVSDLKLINPEIDKKFSKIWNVGEENALKKLDQFINDKLVAYSIDRDFPSCEGTSLLSPHLRFGEISIGRIVYEVKKSKIQKPLKIKFLKELAWREFSSYLLFHFPKSTHLPMDKKFLKFKWKKLNSRMYEQFINANTGYDFVDAGIRQLNETGWMHNRLRMLVGSFLVKDLRYHWLVGAKWFWEKLVDADLASNTLGWQWVAGTGTDASPYFRIFNPELQKQKFDKDSKYVNKWIQNTNNHKLLLSHEKARVEALLEFKKLKGKK